MTRTLCQLSRGDLAVSPLAAVLLEALRARATGVLELEAGGGTSRIFLRGGHPAAVQVFFGFKSFGQFLLELGWIDIVGLERSLAAVAAGRKQGEVLVELGLLSPERLHLGLGLHQQAQLKSLAAQDGGSYRFQPGPELPEWTRDLRMSAHRAIVDALSLGPGQRVVEQILKALPAGQGLQLREGWERSAGPFELDAWEERFVGRLTRPQPLERAIASAPVPPEKARALAACFFLMGLARPVAVAEEPASPPDVGFGRNVAAAQAPADPPRSPSSPPPAPFDPPPPAAPAPTADVGFGRNVVTAPAPTGPGAYLTPGPGVFPTPGPAGLGFGTPGPFRPVTPGPAGVRPLTPGPAAVRPVTPGPSGGRPPAPAPVSFDPLANGFAHGPPPPPAPDPSEERLRQLRQVQERELEAFERSRKVAEAETRRLRAEQDAEERKAREAALSRPPPEFRSDPAQARARRAKMLRRAFGNLVGVPETLRAAAEGTPLPPIEPTPRPDTGSPPGPAASASRPATPGPVAATRPAGRDAAARAARIQERHRRISGEDYFQRLGLPRSATREQVKRAFFTAAKLYHPDRVSPELAHLTRELKEIFTAVNEAYEVLQDEERRHAYEATLDDGAPGADLEEQIRALIVLAETAMRHRAFADAERAYRQAAALKARPDLLAHAAWAVLADPARVDDGPRARTELAALVGRYPKAPAPNYYLGVIARTEGDDQRAERHFREALRANPKHGQAAQELRLLEAKKRKPGGRG